MPQSIESTLCSLYKTLSLKNDTPFHPETDDFYYMGQGKGLDERIYVYLNQNRLFDNMKAWRVIGEIGFGTGLSFCATLDLWRKKKKNGQKLIYISIEKSPLSPNDLKHSLQPWTQALGDSISALLSIYHGLTPGLNLCPLLTDDVILILLVGEASDLLESYEFQADHWMLDGFSPAKNPSAWSAELLSLVTNHSQEGASLTSFTAASHIRDRLSTLGWSIQRQKGFHHKKHCISGRLEGQKTPPLTAPLSKEHVFSLIGHGIAGTSVAYFLNFFGYKSENFYVPNAPCASEAPWIYTQPRFHQTYDEYTAFNLKSYIFSGIFYRQLAPTWIEEQFTAQRDKQSREDERLERIFLCGCRDFFSLEEKTVTYHQGIRANGFDLLKHLQKMSQTKLRVMQEKDIISADFYAHAWASSYYHQSFAQRSLSKGTLFLQNNRTWSMPSHQHCDYTWTRPTSDFFCGFRSQNPQYLPKFGFLENGQGFSLHHGSRGFSSGPYCALLLVLEKLGLFRVKIR